MNITALESHLTVSEMTSYSDSQGFARFRPLASQLPNCRGSSPGIR
jgi:hypothetical protein